MRKLTIPVLAMLIAACSPQAPATYNSTDSIPAIFPDYTDVTIPANIAPLNFLIEEQADAFVTVLSSGSVETVIKGNKVCIPESKWKKLTSTPEITVRVYSRSGKQWTAYRPFKMSVSDEVDPYISYRVIMPSVESYERLSINQRDLTSFSEKVIYANAIDIITRIIKTTMTITIPITL